MKELEESQPKWISVKDRLPEDRQEVLIDSVKGVFLSTYLKDHKTCFYVPGLYNFTIKGVKNWMPLLNDERSTEPMKIAAESAIKDLRLKKLQEENIVKDMAGAELHNENKALRYNLEEWKCENEALNARIKELEADNERLKAELQQVATSCNKLKCLALHLFRELYCYKNIHYHTLFKCALDDEHEFKQTAFESIKYKRKCEKTNELLIKYDKAYRKAKAREFKHLAVACFDEALEARAKRIKDGM